jgi:hypothetical protein
MVFADLGERHADDLAGLEIEVTLLQTRDIELEHLAWSLRLEAAMRRDVLAAGLCGEAALAHVPLECLDGDRHVRPRSTPCCRPSTAVIPS